MQIKIEKLNYIYNKSTMIEKHAIKDVDVSFEQGEFIGVIGPTGSGKTTFIEQLNILTTPTSGKITWVFQNQSKLSKKMAKKYNVEYVNRNIQYEYEDTQVFCAPFKDKNLNKKLNFVKEKPRSFADIRRRVGVVFQFAEYQLFEETILKDVAFGAKMFGLSNQQAEERAKKYLKLVDLPEKLWNHSPFGLSGGQKRRVALAGILAMEPEFLVLDEPTAGLDPAGVIDILNIFKKLHDEGKTVIVITHDLDNILEFSTRCLMFKDGKKIYDGDTYELLKNTEFLYKNEMKPPRILEFVSKLEARGINVPKITNENELVEFLNKYLENKKEI
ncbi:ATP-binding cassette domain-containing protein [Mycoplasma phocimorsus]|uniref:ATP-binding cassette domain-containing protein n=1 Tax=Mycoplasma phocimorsus TaxID=3045839 RepID=A0AAJ1PRT6_9MOLU|nr:ATP-binding cassette domain-containing protein [Mycoplasma phocimorsus]MDJ1645533.1 ATP-binding cassette domain-containing protein [Mycoplasma phocimorsus]MDJ1646624.1 ATP-binding cassette domain-containing protein [Mycoplasma phocimorsus]MDJ1647328.1 ATP-binding cassette domain-containing protein [Mycoplasma phocimorsus]MDJ1647577.1 ATP-binding cassette domain-containing protein [Mycoplasma phocimorsus]MDJ1648079.1 ATP-binding cassette domain-containing protein [Mycoplasma phocimorsus]